MAPRCPPREALRQNSGTKATEIRRPIRKRVLQPRPGGEPVVLLRLLERLLEEDGRAGFARSFGDRHLDGYRPKLTNKEIARLVIEELGSYEFNARAYTREADLGAADAVREDVFDGSRDGDAPDPDTRRSREQLRLSLEGELRNVKLSAGTRKEPPTREEWAAAVRNLRWFASNDANKARKLREELGDDFLGGTWQRRDELIRRWRHRYRKRGLLT
jgi:hypothetical protein